MLLPYSEAVAELFLTKEAHVRFCSRLEAAADRVGPYECLVVPDYPIRQAA